MGAKKDANEKHKCSKCKRIIRDIPFRCKYCKNLFCSKHRLPEDHNCKELEENKSHNLENWKDKINSVKNNYRRKDNYFGDDSFNVSNYLQPIKYKKHKFRKSISDYNIPLYLILILIAFSLISPIYLMSNSPEGQAMQFSIGNPKPIYFYDIDQSCLYYEGSIISSLDYLSEETGIKFIKMESPLALGVGGISYSCENVISTNNIMGNTLGESESGYIAGVVGIPFIIIWNKIRLVDTSREVVIHETLHSMGLDHSDKENTIMYPYVNGIILDEETSKFLKSNYTRKISYFNIIPFNVLLLLAIIAFFTKLYRD